VKSRVSLADECEERLGAGDRRREQYCGTIRCTIPNASFYLIDPASFGPMHILMFAARFI